MPNDMIIRAEGLGKKFVIGHQLVERHTALRDVIAHTAKKFARTTWDMFNGKPLIAGDEVEEFWALKDVSFEINRGEAVGIIGRNGAGKSTLLKVLSRITEPSEGVVTIGGRIASLLEVGTGFHPELSGRENIHLNGAILGMTRAEIKRKFGEIVEFAGVERFLDTPVKRYSSGMYVRLAFAVAAHLEPEILIVDEVLAVGDAEFQQKCMGKMQDVSKGGRTVIFVSHNLLAIKQLCDKAVLLQQGQVIMTGSASDVSKYYSESSIGTAGATFDRNRETGFLDVKTVNEDHETMACVSADQLAYIQIKLRIKKNTGVTAGFTIFNQSDVPLVLSTAAQSGLDLKSGEHLVCIRLPTELLQAGHYRIEGAVWDASEVYHHEDNLWRFEVTPTRGHDFYGRNSPAHFVLRESWKLLS